MTDKTEKKPEKKLADWVLQGKTGMDEVRMLAETRKNNDEIMRCLTGMRPSGKLHLGHYVGALQNWLELQDIENVDNLFLIADYHALGDKDIPVVKQSVRDVALDWLSVGLNPDKGHFVVQSYVPETAELTQFLQTFITKAQVDGNPTLKAEMESIRKGMKSGEDVSMAFYNYTTSQAADILLPRGEIVAVGADQIPHIEATRKVAEKINKKFGPVFPHKPFALLGDTPRLVGVDGKDKMSKSLGNAIMLSDSAEEVTRKVNKMFTDPLRRKATDPGHLEGNVVFMYLDVFCQDKALLQDYKNRYVAGGENSPSDKEVKALLADVLNTLLAPIREKRRAYEEQPQLVTQALEEGSAYARVIGKNTLHDLKEALGILHY